MTAPSFVAEYPTAFNTTTTPKTSMNAVAIGAGDVLVGLLAHADYDAAAPALTENGSASWTVQQFYNASGSCPTWGETYVATGSESLTVTATDASGKIFGCNVALFTGSDGVGATNKAQGTGSPSISLTTTQDNSAIVVVCTDWAAKTGTQTWTNNGGAGSATALTGYPGDGSQYGVAIAYYPDAGSAGSKTLGMSAPTSQTWNLIAIEVKGTAGGAAFLSRLGLLGVG